nr:hypothetical protein JVH1_2843 [Rhodococcus sp. JVH1]
MSPSLPRWRGLDRSGIDLVDFAVAADAEIRTVPDGLAGSAGRS